MNTNLTTCSECHGTDLYTTSVNSAGGHGPVLLPELGGFLRYAKFDVVVCADCGFTRFFVQTSALAKLPQAQQWRHL